MSVDFPKGNGNLIEYASVSGLTGTLHTFFIWYQLSGRLQSSAAALLNITDETASPAHGDYLGLTRGSGSNVGIRFAADWSGGVVSWTAGSSAHSADGNWHSISLTYDSGGTGNNPLARLDGVDQSFNNPTPSGTRLAGVDVAVVGDLIGDSGSHFGLVAHACVWDVLLSVVEQDCLHAGVHPKDIRPKNLVFYSSMQPHNSPQPEESQGGTGTHTGTVNVGTIEPPVARPRFNIWSAIRQAAGGVANFETVTGALAFVGTVSTVHRFFRTVTGALTFVGGITKKMLKPVAGTLSFIGAVAKVFQRFRSPGGVLTFIGAVTTSRQFFRTVTGALTFVGAILKTVKKSVAGALSFIGTLTKTITFKRTVTGALTFSGNAAKKLFEAVAGALTFVGSVVSAVTFARVVTGALTFIGTVTPLKTFFRTVTGALTFAGSVTKKVFKAVAGALTFAGSVAAVLQGAIFQAVGGTLSFIGDVSKKTLKPLAGALTFAGAITKVFKRLRTVTGALTFIGVVTTVSVFSRTVTGALTFAGTASKKTLKGVTGALSFIGTLTRTGTFKRALTGSLSFSGSVATKVFEAIAGALSFIGALVTKFIQGGVADLTGTIIPNLGWVLSPAANVTWRNTPADAQQGNRYIELRTEQNRTDGGVNGNGQAITDRKIQMGTVAGQQLFLRMRVRWTKLPGDSGEPASELRILMSGGVLSSTLIKVGDTLDNPGGWNLVTQVLTLSAAATEFNFTFLTVPKNVLTTPYLEAWGIDGVELYREPSLT